jgi:hypothetical protein
MISGEPKWSDDESAEKGLRDLNFSMCGREDLASHIEELRAKGEQQCNKVWAKGKIAYRCRTCQLNDSRWKFSKSCFVFIVFDFFKLRKRFLLDGTCGVTCMQTACWASKSLA